LLSVEPLPPYIEVEPSFEVCFEIRTLRIGRAR
jgi:hypothetical protein